MKVVITIEVTEALEDAAALEAIEALLEACGADYTWENEE
jgi:hypothetical protein